MIIQENERINHVVRYRLLLFTLTSSVSYVGMLLIIFSLFRIQHRYYIPHMVFVCVTMSYISFTTREASLALYSPLIQMGFLIILLWLLFRLGLLLVGCLFIYHVNGKSERLRGRMVFQN